THLTLMALLDEAERTGSRGAPMRRLRQALAGQAEFARSREELTPVRRDPWSLVPLAAVSALVLLSPQTATALVTKTVGSYALSAEAVKTITSTDFPHRGHPAESNRRQST